LRNNELWKLHIQNFKSMRWKYYSWKEFPHHCTDGPKCPIANIYYKKEVLRKLNAKGLKVNKTIKAHFPVFQGKMIKYESILARRVGFFQFYYGGKIEE
jgi:hypothetical protein